MTDLDLARIYHTPARVQAGLETPGMLQSTAVRARSLPKLRDLVSQRLSLIQKALEVLALGASAKQEVLTTLQKARLITASRTCT